MTKSLLISITLLIFLWHLNAQEIKVKGGQVLKDKVPIAKLEGKIGLFRYADLTISSLTDQPLITIQEKQYDYFNPDFKDWSYYDISFSKTQQRAMVRIAQRYASERGIAEFLFRSQPSLFVAENTIDSASIAAFMATNDFSAEFTADTTEKNDYERKLISKLGSYTFPRNHKSPVILTVTNEGYNIFQDDVLLGKIEKKIVRDSNPNVNSKVDYVVYKRFQSPPLLLGRVILNFGMLAYINCQAVCSIGIIQTKKYMALNDIAPYRENAQQHIAELLIAKGFL